MKTFKPIGCLFSRKTVNSIEAVCSCSTVSKMSDHISRSEAESVDKDELIMNHPQASPRPCLFSL